MMQSNEWPIVADTIARAAGLEADAIKPDMDLLSDLNMDSLAVFEVAVDLEAHYDMTIPDEEIERLHTAGEVVRFVEEKKRAL